MPDRGRAKLLTAITVLAGACVYLAGNGRVSLFDRDEPRFAQCSRQMLESGDWVVPRLYDEVRTAKPVFIYWCQATVMRILGDNAFAARLPSAVAMPITLLVVAGFVWRAAGPARAAWATFVLASCVMVLVSAKACLTDSMLLLWITAGQVCLYMIWRGRGTWPVVLTFAASVALAGLTKGPVVLGVHGTTLLALWLLNRGQRASTPASQVAPSATSRHWLAKVLAGAVVIAVIAGPWVYLLETRQPGFIRAALLEVFTRVRTGLEQHGGPPGYHLVTIWAFFLPWSLFLPLAFVNGWKHRHLPLVRFSLAAVVGPWVMFEIVTTKLPHYMLPTYPSLAILVADAIVRCLRGQLPDLDGRPFRLAVGFLALALAVAAPVPALAAARLVGDPVWPGIVLAVAAWAMSATLLALLAWPRPDRRRRRLVPGLVALGLTTIVLWAVGWTVFLPRAQFLRLSIRAAEVLKREGATGPGTAIMLDYKEPSLAFYQGGTIRPDSRMALSHDLLDQGPEWLVITDEVWRRTPPDVRDRVREYGRFRGLSYADEGRVLEVMVVRNPTRNPTRRTD